MARTARSLLVARWIASRGASSPPWSARPGPWPSGTSSPARSGSAGSRPGVAIGRPEPHPGGWAVTPRQLWALALGLLVAAVASSIAPGHPVFNPPVAKFLLGAMAL